MGKTVRLAIRLLQHPSSFLAIRKSNCFSTHHESVAGKTLTVGTVRCLWTETQKLLQKAPRENASGSWLLVIVRSEKYYIIALFDGILSKHDLVNVISLNRLLFKLKA